MKEIKVFGLGGLNENGKNLYIVEIDGKIFIFDAGLKYATDKMFGIDYIIPNFNYLIANKEKIVGLFLSHAHYENFGAVKDLVKEIPDVKIFATKFTSIMLNEEFKENNIKFENVNIINSHKRISFGEISVFPFSVTHSVPESVGYSINTKYGAIVYMCDFIIDPTMSEPYDMDLGRLAYIGKQGTLLLMCESVFAEKKGFSSPKHKLEDFFTKVVEKYKERIIFSVLPLHLYTIQEIFNAVENKNRKIVIMNKKLLNIINIAINNNYLKVDKNQIGDIRNLNDSDAIIFICNDREQPYTHLNKIVSGYDKFVKLKDTDTICFAEPSYDSYEMTLVRLLNDIAIKGVNIETVPKENSVRHHASSEDLMMIIKLFNPKYYMPIKGEYRYMINNANLATSVGMKKENILLKENGDVITFIDGELSNKSSKVHVDSTLIDGKSSDDVGELVIKDRQALSDNGLVLISATLDKRTKNVVAGPEILTRGFIYVKENVELINKIKDMSLEIINSNIVKNYADYQKIKNDLRSILGKFLYNETECKPMILVVLQEV